MTETRLHVVVVTFQIRPETTGPFEALLTRNASLSLDLEPSCIQFDICRSTQDPASFVLYELYESAQAFADHLRHALVDVGVSARFHAHRRSLRIAWLATPHRASSLLNKRSIRRSDGARSRGGAGRDDARRDRCPARFRGTIGHL